MRVINIVNRSSVVNEDDFRRTVIAVQKQVSNDFAPAWGLDCLLTLLPEDSNRERILVLDNSDQANALGYHTESGDVPVGYVFAKSDLDATGSWSDTLSHEVLEQIADPLVNLCAMGRLYGRMVAFAYESCDAVENDEYFIDGLKVSNFILPQWFSGDAPGKVDFMGTLAAPFQLSRGGYISYQTRLGVWAQMFGREAKPHQRTPAPLARRSRRYARTGTDHHGIDVR